MSYPKKLKANKHCELNCEVCPFRNMDCKYKIHNLIIDMFEKEIKNRASIKNISKIIWKIEGFNKKDVSKGYIDWVNKLAKAISKHITGGL